MKLTIDEVIEEIKNASDDEVRYGDIKHNYDLVTKRIDAFDIALKSLKQTKEIKEIIAIPNSIIQEDVIKYKMICEVLK